VQTLTRPSCVRSLRRAACAALLVIALSSFAVPGAAVSAIVPEGVWFIDGAAAVQIFDCSGQLAAPATLSERRCGRIIWLRAARDTAGRLGMVLTPLEPWLGRRHGPIWHVQGASLDHGAPVSRPGLCSGSPLIGPPAIGSFRSYR
jgi:hypothetical protein